MLLCGNCNPGHYWQTGKRSHEIILYNFIIYIFSVIPYFWNPLYMFGNLVGSRLNTNPVYMCARMSDSKLHFHLKAERHFPAGGSSLRFSQLPFTEEPGEIIKKVWAAGLLSTASPCTWFGLNFYPNPAFIRHKGFFLLTKKVN